MKTLKMVLAIAFIALTTNAFSQTFSAKDLDGVWTRSDGLVISISGTATFSEGSNAIVLAVGSSGWNKSIQHRGFKFRNIKYLGTNTWEAKNFMYMPLSDYMKQDGEVTIVMSDDKKSFRAGGFKYSKK